MRTMDLWRATFESELTFSEASQTVSADGVHYVIIDGTQQGVYRFWAGVSRPTSPTVHRLSRCSFLRYISFYSSPEPMVCAFFASLDMVRRMSRRLQHPLHSWILEDLITRSRLPLGLAFLRLDREFTNKLIVKFTEVKGSQNKTAMLDSDVNDLIYEETNDHVGAIRAILSPDLFSTDRRSKQDVLDFIRHDIYQADLNAFRMLTKPSSNNYHPKT